MAKKIISVFLVVVLCLCALFGCAVKPREFSGSFLDTFDTVITLYGLNNNATEFNEYAAVCHDEFLYYHKLFDIYNSYEGINNLKTVNDNAGIAPVKVDGSLIEFMEFALNTYSEANGKVNIAMGSVLSLWHKYRTLALSDSAVAALPEKGALSAAANLIDISLVEINKEESTIYLKTKGMSLDVGALGKGYACKKVAAKLISLGYENFVINAGGNVYANGANISANLHGWNIGIQNPDTASSAYLDTVLVSNGAVVTAGNYQRNYTVGDKSYGHIIDPETLMPAENYLSVTVIGHDSAIADYLATELYLSDIEAGKKLCEKFAVDAIWVLNGGEVEYTLGYGEYSRNFSK